MVSLIENIHVPHKATPEGYRVRIDLRLALLPEPHSSTGKVTQASIAIDADPAMAGGLFKFFVDFELPLQQTFPVLLMCVKIDQKWN